MAADDAVAYHYINVGIDPPEIRDGLAYHYINVIDRGSKSYVGKVVGFAGFPYIAEFYVYANNGFYLVSSPDGLAYIYMNQLEQVSGSTRNMEDGVIRHLEDGTTARTLE